MANWLAFTRAHCAVYRGTRGTIGGSLIGIKMLLLTTRGRKSGLARTLPLAYVEHGGDYVVVASNGGAAQPPAWWLNLSAGKTAEVQVGGERFEVEWSHAPTDERMEYWRKLQAAIPAYRMYRTRTDREIPIIRLTPTDSPKGTPTRDRTRSLAGEEWQSVPVRAERADRRNETVRPD